MNLPDRFKIEISGSPAGVLVEIRDSLYGTIRCVEQSLLQGATAVVISPMPPTERSEFPEGAVNDSDAEAAEDAERDEEAASAS